MGRFDNRIDARVSSMAFCAIACLALFSQRPSAQQPRGATIEGVVVERESNAPIGRVSVELRRIQSGPQQPSNLGNVDGLVVLLDRGGGGPTAGGTASVAPDSKVVATAADGTFVIRDIPPGEYRLYATRSSGHVPGEYGQRTATGTGDTFTLAAGQRMTGVSLVMTPTVTITGLITDANGEPAGYAHVHALRAVYRDGQRSLTGAQVVQADDRGVYRLFWLAPGDYYVCARPLDLRRSSEMMHITAPSRFETYEQQQQPTVTAVNTSRLLEDGSTVEERFVPVCYPGTTDEQKASRITLRAGQIASSVDISLAESLVRTRHIRGRVIDGMTGKPVAASLQVIPRNSQPILLIPTGQANQDGIFDMWGLLPGPSYLVARGTGLGLLSVDIGDSDLNGVILTMWSTLTIAGRIRIEGRPQGADGLDASGITVTLQRTPALNGLPSSGTAAGGPVTVSPDGRIIQRAASNRSASNGSFTVAATPGEFSVVLTPKNDTYVQSIYLGSRDVLNGGLRVDGPVQGELDIVLGANGGALEGLVTGPRREPAAGVTVVVVPESSRRHRSDLFKVAKSDATGRYRFRGLAPGSYELFAWEDVEPGAWYDADFMRSGAGLGRSIRVDDGARLSVDATLIPSER